MQIVPEKNGWDDQIILFNLPQNIIQFKEHSWTRIGIAHLSNSDGKWRQAYLIANLEEQNIIDVGIEGELIADLLKYIITQGVDTQEYWKWEQQIEYVHSKKHALHVPK